MSIRSHIVRRIASVAAALFLAACGGGDDTSVSGAVPEPVTRVEVTPAALLLTAGGQQQRLIARGFDAQGREVASAAVVWQASRPEQVGVDADGTVHANVALGAGQVVAVVGGVRSAPVLVSVAQPQPGVTLVDDSQVLAGPSAVGAPAEPDVDNAYDVVLAGLPAPAPGSLLLGREGIALGGEVLESEAVTGGVRVRLRLVPIERLMLTAQIQEEIDLRGLPLQLPPDLAARYDVRQEGDEYVFTPRQGVPAAAGGRKRAQELFKEKIGPFECELALPDVPVALAQPAQFSIKFEPVYTVDYDRNAGLRRLSFKAETAFKMKANLQISAVALLNATCEATLYERLAPLPGWAGLVLAGELKAGVGFELEGSVTIPLMGAELTAESKGPMEAGIDCTSGTCLLVNSWDPVTTNTLRFTAPDQSKTTTRSEIFLFGYGFGKLKAGLTTVPEVRVDVVTARGGLKFETSLASEVAQMAPLAAELPDYRSDYKLHLLAEVAAGSVNKGDSALRKLLQKLGVFKVSLLKAQISRPVGVSPKGAVTVDRSVFADGDTLNFNVRLDAATADFPLLGYNVRRVRIVRLTDGLQAREVASVDATPGQLSFDLSWVASGTAGETGGSFHAFVDTVLPTEVGLELGKASLAPQLLSGSFSLVYTENEDRDDGSGNVYTSRNTFEARGRAVQSSPGSDSLSLVDAGGANRLQQTETTKGEKGRLLPDGRECKFAMTSVGSTSADLPMLAGDGNEAEFSFTGNDWRLGGLYIDFMGDLTSSFKATASKLSGPDECSVFNLDVPESEQTEVGRRVSLRKSFTPPLPAISGTFGSNPTNGRRTLSIAASAGGPLPGSTPERRNTFSLTLNMTLEDSLAAAAPDLALALDALPFAEPLGFMTYAVNLSNTGGRVANEVRVEFTLPAGWTLVGTTGWSGCSMTGTVVVCRAASLGGGARRAFLVDVQAPDGTGTFIARASVSAAEGDSDFGNNTATLVTEISP
jgi:uncharacterized repeat protein (TIGR01451 family)